MRRREFIAVLGGAATWPVGARAQVSARPPLIAVISGASQAASERWRRGLPQGLHELGLIEGRHYEIEYRYANGNLTRLPALVDELIQHKPNVFVIGTSDGVLAAKQATATTPIVYAGMIDPISIGLAASYARPGGNVTGMFSSAESLFGKQLALGFELIPGAKRAAMLSNTNMAFSSVYRLGFETAARSMNADTLIAEVRTPTEIDSAFQMLARARISMVAAPADPMLLNERRRIAELAITTKLPVVYGVREYVEDGGLISYGVDLRENFRRAAMYVDKILKGAKPADLPFEQPTKFELVINLRAARAIGLDVSESFLLRADEVIE
jgi:ABC-type uncharacterized transport system substrate-binding protein